MSSRSETAVQNVKAAIQSISDICLSDKHEYLKDACLHTLQQMQNTNDNDELANLLFYPLKVVATMRSKSDQRFFMFSSRGLRQLVLTELFSLSTKFTPPALPFTMKKKGMFAAKDATTPTTDPSSPVFEGPADELKDCTLVEELVEVIEYRTNVLRADNVVTSHTSSENVVFMEHLKCLCRVMMNPRYGIHGKELVRCFQIAMTCSAELRPFDSRCDSAARDALPHVLTVFLGRANLILSSPEKVEGSENAIERVVDGDCVETRDCALLLDLLSTSPPEKDGGTSREDFLQCQLGRVMRLFLLSQLFDELPEILCRSGFLVEGFVKKTCPFLLAGVISPDVESNSQALKTLQIIIERFGFLLRSKVVNFVLGVLVPYLECDQTSSEKKEEILIFLQRVLSSPTVLAEWLINFDCRVGAPMLVSRLVERLGKLKAMRADSSSNRRLSRKMYNVLGTLVRTASSISSLDNQEVSEIVHSSRATTGVSRVSLASAEELKDMIAEKRKYMRVIFLFNEAKDYKAAVKLASEIKDFMDACDPYGIAHFLITCEDLNPVEVGNFLCRNDAETASILRAFIDMHDFSGLTIDEAVRLLLGTFRINGEAETVDRTVTAFSEAYCQQNPGSPPTSSITVLAFSIVMLNTDAHSTRVKEKMTLEQYVRNLRGTNNGKDFPTTVLSGIYKRVVGREIQTWRQFPTYVLLNKAKDQQSRNKSPGSGSPELCLTENARAVVGKDNQADRYYTCALFPELAGVAMDGCWTTLLPAFSYPLEESTDKEEIDFCLEAFSDCIAICARQGRHEELKTFLAALNAFSHLTNLRVMQYKNQRALALIFEVAHKQGNYLGEGWDEVICSVSRIGRLISMTPPPPDPRKPAVTSAVTSPVFAYVPMLPSADPTAFGSLRSPTLSGPVRTPSGQRPDILSVDTLAAVKKENASILFQHISEDEILSLFSNSADNLSDCAVVCMVQALCRWASEESKLEPQSMFIFRILMEVLRLNFWREVSVWRTLWDLASHPLFSVITASADTHDSVYGFKCLRKMTALQLGNAKCSKEGSLICSIFELYQNIADACETPLMDNAVASTVGKLIRCSPDVVRPGWPAILTLLLNCFHRNSNQRLRVAMFVHEISTTLLAKVEPSSECLAMLFRVWGAIAREEAVLEKYALWHIRYLLSALFHTQNRRKLKHAAGLMNKELPEDEQRPVFTNDTLFPSFSVIHEAILYLDSEGGDTPSFSLSVVGFNELASLAAAFHSRESLAETAADALLDSTACFHKHVDMLTSVDQDDKPDAQECKKLWTQLYAQCDLNLVDVYVNAVKFPLAACKGSSTPARAADRGGSTVPPSPDTEKDRSVTTPSPRSRRGAPPSLFPSASASPTLPTGPSFGVATVTQTRSAEQVSAMALTLLERLVSLLVKQELRTREEVQQTGSEDDGEVVEQEGELGATPQASPSSGAAPVIPAHILRRVTGEVVNADDAVESLAASSLATSRSMSPQSPPIGGRRSSAAPSPAAASAKVASDQMLADVVTSADVLDEARRDEVQEVNLDLVECLLTRLCPSTHPKIRELGFLALRKLILSRLEGALSPTNRQEMTDLAKTLKESLQSFFQEHIVNSSLTPPHMAAPPLVAPRATPPLVDSFPGQPGSSAPSSRPSDNGQASSGLSRLPAESVVRGCINYIDLIGLLVQQEVTLSTGAVDGLLDEGTVVPILKYLQEVYMDTSKVLAMDFFSTLQTLDGPSRAEGERILAMLITLECTISNVFIDMEVSRDPSSHPVGPRSPTRGPDPDQNSSRIPSESDAEYSRASSVIFGGGSSRIHHQVEMFRMFVLTTFLKASKEAKRPPSLPAMAAGREYAKGSLANQQQLMTARTVVRSFLESLQQAPLRVMRRLMPRYRIELCELINSCDEELAPILSDILLKYLSNA